MKSARSIRRASSVSGAFTATAKIGSQSRHARWVVAVAAALLAAPIAAHPQTGSTSSASVGISVSVAPSFRLMSNEPAAQHEADYCIATNGQQLTLPILLVDANGSQQATDPASALPWCGVGQGKFRDDAKRPRPPGILIVRPE